MAKIPFLAFSHYHGNHFSKFFAYFFKLGQNLSSCQVSEKYTYQFGQNDGKNIQTERQKDNFYFFPDIPPVVKPFKCGSPPSLKVWSKSNRGILRNGRTLLHTYIHIYIGHLYIDIYKWKCLYVSLSVSLYFHSGQSLREFF